MARAYDFRGGSVTVSDFMYQDHDCQDPSPIEGEELQGTFRIGAETEVSGTMKIDLDLTSSSGRRAMRYDIFRHEGRTLWFGYLPGESEESRATQLDTSWIFSRQ